jgi:hypothetical protein
MSDERESSTGLNPIEQALRSFAPIAPQLDRDRLMFLAGRANAEGRGLLAPSMGNLSRSERATRWLWPASSAALAATSLALAIALFTRSTPQPQLIVRDAPASAVAPQSPVSNGDTAPRRQYATALPRPAPANSESYLKTREVAFRMGLDALGSPPSGGSELSPGTTYIELLEALAAPPAGPAASPAERFPNM